MTRMVALNALDGGITRQRVKGGANPKWLYDLVNGYVGPDGKVYSRPGTTDEIQLPEGTRGLCSANGKLVVFASSVVASPDPLVEVEVLTHPTDPTAELLDIHFAAPFLGGASGVYLYVVAEFNDSSVYHYWLRHADTWEASTVYQLGDLVEPTVPNGFVYRASRLGDPGVLWAPGVKRAVGDVVEPTTFNGFSYECVETIGDNPRSGAAEPVWPEEDGAQVIEDTERDQPTTPSTGTTDPGTDLPPDLRDRYANRAGTTL